MIPLFVTCARGTEAILGAEIAALGLGGIAPERGGVRCEGSERDLWRANLMLRTAHRVLVRIAAFPARDARSLYEGARTVAWQDHLTPAMTFAVDCTRAGAREGDSLGHTHFAALKVKDAIADELRDRIGARPSVDTRAPDVRIRAHLAGGECVLYLDSSGESLHRRGYRPPDAPAPLRETLAAAIVLWTGWDARSPLCDPLCGSGTILVEAALLSRNLAPGLGRRFGFERWLGFDARAYARLQEETRALARPARAVLAGSDRDPHAVALARRSARAAGVERDVSFAVRDLADAAPPAPPPGWVVCNPPYGERLGDVRAAASLHRTLGRVLKQRFAGYTAFVLSGAPDAASSIGLRPSRRTPLYNGPIECRLLRFDLYSGSRRAPR